MGDSAAFTVAAVPAERPPTPNPSPPRAMRVEGGEPTASQEGLFEQVRRVIDSRAFDGKHFQLGGNPAIGGKTARLAACGKYPVTRHHDRAGIAPKGLANIA